MPGNNALIAMCSHSLFVGLDSSFFPYLTMARQRVFSLGPVPFPPFTDSVATATGKLLRGLPPPFFLHSGFFFFRLITPFLLLGSSATNFFGS